MSLKTQSTFNLHVNISFKEVIECVERLRLEALGQLTVEALLVGFPQERINVLVGAQADVVEQMSRALSALHRHWRSLSRDVCDLLIRVLFKLQALHARH